MPKWLLQTSYSVEGVRGLAKEGGSKRRAALDESVSSVGGRVDAFYFVLGDYDIVAIVDLPDSVSVAALALAGGASGTNRVKASLLVTAEEMDRAAATPVTYRPGGT